ncbi:MAG: hypothetical protein JHC33_08565 [Ignisphaera sp.]|nr:hypothetical protein [Ignisphaera sp.]
MAQFKYVPRTNRVTTPLENDWFRYDMDDPKNLPYDMNLPLMLDTETHSDEMRDIRLIQLFQETWEKPIIIDTNSFSVDYIYSYIKYYHIVAHAVSFEIGVFRTDLGRNTGNSLVCPFSKFSDTFLLARKALFNKVDGFGFDSVSKYIHQYDYYSEYAKTLGWSEEEAPLFKKSLQKSFLDSPKSNKRSQGLYYEQLHYAALDVLLLSKVYKELKYVEDEFIIQLDYKVIPALQEWQGLPIDQNKVAELKTKFNDIELECSLTLPPGLNVNSYVQVRKLLNIEGSDDTALAEVEDQASRFPDDDTIINAKFAKAIRSKRSAIKSITFLEKYEGDRFNGYASPRTISGRLAMENHNLMQIARTLKGAFGTAYQNERDGTNKVLLHYDYAALELRMAAVRLNETVLIELFEQEADLHRYAGSQIYDKPEEEINDHERFVGKTANFGLLYGAGGARFALMCLKNAGLYITEEDAKVVVKGWKKAYPVIKAWHDKMGRSKDQIDHTLNGRDYKANMYSDLLAIGNQGSAAEVFKLALVYLYKSKIPICVGIHDSFILECDTIEEARIVGEKLYKCALTGWFEGIKNSLYPTLPMPGAVSIGLNWGEMEKGQALEKIKYKGTYEEYLSFRDNVLNGEL